MTFLVSLLGFFLMFADNEQISFGIYDIAHNAFCRRHCATQCSAKAGRAVSASRILAMSPDRATSARRNLPISLRTKVPYCSGHIRIMLRNRRW